MSVETMPITIQGAGIYILAVQGGIYPSAFASWSAPYVTRKGVSGCDHGNIQIKSFFPKVQEQLAELRKGDIVNFSGTLGHNLYTCKYTGQERDGGYYLAVSHMVIVKRGAASKVLDAPQPELERDQPVTRASLSDALAELTGKVPPTSWRKAKLESEIKRLTATSTLR